MSFVCSCYMYSMLHGFQVRTFHHLFELNPWHMYYVQNSNLKGLFLVQSSVRLCFTCKPCSQCQNRSSNMVDSPFDFCKVVCQNVKSDSGCTTSTIIRLYVWEVQTNWTFELFKWGCPDWRCGLEMTCWYRFCNFNIGCSCCRKWRYVQIVYGTGCGKSVFAEFKTWAISRLMQLDMTESLLKGA